MTLYACVANGFVTRILATVGPSPVIPVGSWVDVDAVSPRPDVGWTAAQSGGAWSFTAPTAPSLTLPQRALAALAQGLTITLSGTATLFPIDPATQQKLAAVVTTLLATGAFPGGATSYPMKDSAGAWHTFDEATYKAVAGAVAAYVSALTLIVDGNPLNATALPSASVSLTAVAAGRPRGKREA